MLIRVSPRPTRSRPGQPAHAELENGVSVGMSDPEVKKSWQLGAPAKSRGGRGTLRFRGWMSCPEMPSASGADPELIRLPRVPRRRVAHLHRGAAALAPHRNGPPDHVPDSIGDTHVLKT